MLSEQPNPPLGGISLTGHDGKSRRNWIRRMMAEENYINSINYEEFENPRSLTTGSSSVIQKAWWTTKNRVVVLKQILPEEPRIEESEHEELVKEIKAFHSVNNNINDTDHKYIIEFLGISSPLLIYYDTYNLSLYLALSNEEKFFLVLEYADIGDLHNYLIQNCLEWDQKVEIVRHIICGLRFLHKNEILHRDLHTGNVVIKSDSSNKFGIRAVITDFGLSRVVSRNSISNQRVKARFHFMDPIIFIEFQKRFGEIYDYPSDIYSLGVIMWDISSNGQGISKANLRADLVKILFGKREKPVAGSTLSYVKLYEKCWDDNPSKRPDINRVYELIHEDDILLGEKIPAELDPNQNDYNASDNRTVGRYLLSVIEQFYDEHPVCYLLNGLLRRMCPCISDKLLDFANKKLPKQLARIFSDLK
ncbi:32484_t:CDS:2 [Racocetra persica]|uniref:32484_t:CDS:1 n=1 Tax=Racocetra persica TaxID=160502 RepID=A0ACA9M1J7_9GLOM|nr:32484_t:CDS:2 [Racocetra persica]